MVPPPPRSSTTRSTSCRASPCLATLALAAASLAAGCRGTTASAPTPALPGAVKVAAADFPLEPPPEPGEDPDGPVTHVGRSVLAKCHKMVVAKVVTVRPAGPGAEIARIEESEVLWGPPETDEGPYAVLCGGRGLSPPPGASALFLLRLLPAGDYEALEVAPLGDADGPVRLRTFRRILEIESAADAESRHAALLAYLRGAVVSDEAWIRSNAVREYAAYTKAFPGRLRTEDGAAIARALPMLRDAELKRLAQRALDRAPSAAPAKPSAPRTATSAPAADLGPFTKRFDDAPRDPAERRRAVLEAAARLDAAAGPLVARGLADPEAVVREASAAAAGEAGIAALVPTLLPLLVTDPSVAVRTTVVIALGHLGAASAVESIAGLARSEPAFERETLFALGRIRNDAAMAHLRALRGTGDTERARLVDFILSEDFVRQERAMGARWATGK